MSQRMQGQSFTKDEIDIFDKECAKNKWEVHLENGSRFVYQSDDSDIEIHTSCDQCGCPYVSSLILDYIC